MTSKTRPGFAQILLFFSIWPGSLLIANSCANLIEHQEHIWPVLRRNLTHSQPCGSIQTDLGRELSESAAIFTTDDQEFPDLTKRWQEWENPQFACVVEVANEDDVKASVVYANRHNIPFLASNGGHGATMSLGALRSGMLISLRQLDKVEVHEDTATIGGGTLNIDATAKLRERGKQAVVGSCECVSVLGPLLGGGHSLLQGIYGLAADNLVKARVVLADGKVITASDVENSDLFWALRGAGHNFGIVTEIEYKVSDISQDDSWFYENYFFAASSVDSVMEKMFEINGNDQPGELMIYAVFLRAPAMDAQNAVIALTVIYNGPGTNAREYVETFRNLGPISFANGTATYSDMPAITLTSNNDAICKKIGVNRLRYPLYMKSYEGNYPQEAYKIFNSTTSEHPELGASLFLIEGYSSRKVREVPLESTAVALRDHGILVSPAIEYPVDAGLDEAAFKFGQQLRQASVEAAGGNFHTYVNYAFGDESLESRYGYQTGRLERLRRLKQKYDPQNKFQWYNPLVTS